MVLKIRVLVIIFIIILFVVSQHNFFYTQKQDSIIFDYSFCPSKNCSNLYIDNFESAKDSIYCALYDLNYDVFAKKLNKKFEKNLDVKLIVDSDYKHREMFEILNEVDITFDTNRNTRYNNLMHHKFCVVDSSKIITGTANPTENGFFKNNNVVFYFNSTFLSKKFEEEFFQMKNGKFGENKKQINANKILYFNSSYIKELEIFFCPQDDCENVLVQEINDSSKSIKFAQFVLTHNKVEDLLIEKLNQGIEIEGVIESRSWNLRGSRAKYLSNHFPLTRFENSATMHHKFFVIDAKTLLIGSMNPSHSGTRYNDELLLKLEGDIVKEFLDEINSLK